MGTVSRVHTFSSGAILTAAQLNNEFDNLLTSSAINGGLDATNLGVTAGQATASKALVVDSSRNLADGTAGNRINNLALSGTFESTGAITATAGITSGGNIVSDTDSTDDLGTTGVRWANLYVDSIGDSGQALAVAATTLSFDAASTIDTSGNNNLTLDAGTATLTLDAATIESDASTLSFDAAASIDTSGNNNLSLDAGTATLTLDAGTIESDAGTLSFDGAASIDTSGNNALEIDTGSANLNITAGTLALTGAQTISSTLGVSGNVTISKDAPYLILTDSGTGGGTSKIAVDAVGSNHGFYFQVDADTLFVDSVNDRVGFSEANPDTLIHASQGGEPPAEGMLILEANSSSRQLRIQPPTNADNGFFDSRGGNMTFLDDGTEIWRYNASTISTSSGIDVGIGTASVPSDMQLAILGNYQTGFYRNVTSGDRAYILNIGAKESDGTLTAGTQIGGSLESGDADGHLYVSTLNSGSMAEALRVTKTGDLLIGTTSDQIARVYATTGTSGDYAGYFKNTVSNRGVLFLENTNTSLADAMHRMTASAAYNGSSAAYSFLVATGNAASSADTEFILRGDGEAFADGAWNASGADYQEYFESTSGESAEVGRAIVLDGDKVRYYNADTDSTDDIMGVTRPQADNKNSAFVGNVAWNHWTDKYLTDDWGVYLREDVTVWTYTDEKGDEYAVYERAEIAKDADWTPPSGATSSTQSVRKLNPDYDESLVEGYQSREERDEWWLIGLLGQIQVKAGEPVNPRWIKMKNISDAVELYYVR